MKSYANSSISNLVKKCAQVTAEDDVIIRVGFAGLCGTDLHIVSVCFAPSTPSTTIYFYIYVARALISSFASGRVQCGE